MEQNHTSAFIAQWHRIFAENDPALMLPLIHEDIEFFSPALFRPKHGKDNVFATLKRVFGIFERYRVTDTWVRDNEVLFEFETQVEGYRLQGIDRFRLDEEGKIIEMKVWIRPLTGLKHLAGIVARRELDDLLADKSFPAKIATRAKFRMLKLLRALGEGLN